MSDSPSEPPSAGGGTEAANGSVEQLPQTSSSASAPSAEALNPAPPEEQNNIEQDQPEASGSESVEIELRELLGKMEESYKEFSETVFEKMDSMREKIAQLDESVVDLNQGLDTMDSVDSPASSGKARSAMQRKRRE